MSSNPTTPTIVWAIRPERVNYHSLSRLLSLHFEHAAQLPRNLSAPVAAVLDLLRDELLSHPAVREYINRLDAARAKRVIITGGNWDGTEHSEAKKFAECARHPAMTAILNAARAFAESAAAKDPTPTLLRELAERCQGLLLAIAAAQQIQSARTQFASADAGEDAAGRMLDVLAPR